MRQPVTKSVSNEALSADQLRRMISLETRFAALGEMPAANEAPVFTARVIEADFVKAEALVLAQTKSVHIFDLLRTALSRGDLSNASMLIELIESQLENVSKDSADNAEPNDAWTELLLEAARLASFEGDWQKCAEYARRALALAPAGISQLALRQVLGTALIELGQFNDAHREIELALSLAKLFPHVNLATYVAATKVRWLIRTGSFKQAKAVLDSIWSKTKSLNIDLCVVLLRVELELRRETARETQSLAFAIWMLCRSSGDRLYEAIAAADLEIDFEGEWRSVIAEALTYKRVQEMQIRTTEKASPLSLSQVESMTHIVLHSQKLMIDLESMTVRPVVLSPQLWKALESLSLESIDRADYFSRLWGSQKFVVEIHDDIVRRVIYRLRRATGLAIDVNDSKIALLSAWNVHS